jgi:hypothetical protein
MVTQEHSFIFELFLQVGHLWHQIRVFAKRSCTRVYMMQTLFPAQTLYMTADESCELLGLSFVLQENNLHPSNLDELVAS